MSVAIKQIYTKCMAQASYIVADQKSGRAAIIDPLRDVDQYKSEADALGVEITDVIHTHSHADFVGGHGELKNDGAQVHLSEKSPAEFDFNPVKEGDRLEFGDTRLEFLETPGHTPDSISVLVYDLSKSEQIPQAVATGDTAFVGGQGRVDLTASGDAADLETLASLQFDSIQKLKTLPDQTALLPGHGAGSLCGTTNSSETTSTIKIEKATNPAFQYSDRSRFIADSISDLPFAPRYFQEAVAMNLSELPATGKMEKLSVDKLQAMRVDGVQILDTRTPGVYGEGHLPGSINIGMSEASKFAPWAGTFLNSEKPIVLVADNEGAAKEAQTRLNRVTLSSAGYVTASDLKGETSLEATPQLNSGQLASELSSDEPPLVLDVRTDNERMSGHIEGSVHIPLHELAQRAEELPGDREVVVHCASGYRSAIAMGVLEQNHEGPLSELRGGIMAWQRAGMPVAVDR